MKESKWKPFLPIIILFIVLTVAFYAGAILLWQWGIIYTVLLGGNFILCIATLLSCLVAVNGFKSKTGAGSVRGIYGSFIVKFFICVLAAFIYIFIARKDVNKPALFVCMGLYIVYTILEVSILTKLSNQKKNA